MTGRRRTRVRVVARRVAHLRRHLLLLLLLLRRRRRHLGGHASRGGELLRVAHVHLREHRLLPLLLRRRLLLQQLLALRLLVLLGHGSRLALRLLALLLRLSAHRGGDTAEISRRTREVLDQFERNPDQQQFMLTIIEKLDERSLAAPADFNEIALTVLSEVAQNGVQTISSVSGEGLALCEKAMTTLLQTLTSLMKVT